MSNEDTYVYDFETREYFTKEFWSKNKLLNDNVINLSKHITTHFYSTGDYCRIISLWMYKFWLPDISIEKLSCYSSNSIINLLNLTAQTIFEKEKVDDKSSLLVDIDLLKNKELKEELLWGIIENAKKKWKINLVKWTWQEWDPRNRIIEISFPEKNPQIEQDILISQIFWSKDEVDIIQHNDKIIKASNKAKEKIPELYNMFNKGLDIWVNLLLKFPFQSKSWEQEWMWVEVIEWDWEAVKWILQNDPQIVNLKSWEEVVSNINDMFDYIIYFQDGTQEWNETWKIIINKNKKN